MPRPISVLIVDDHAVVREGLRAFLQLQDGIAVADAGFGIFWVAWEAHRASRDFLIRLTTQRFMHKKGVLRCVANQILLVDIDDVAYEQGLLDRFVNVGTITLHSNDPSDPVLPLRGIDDV